MNKNTLTIIAAFAVGFVLAWVIFSGGKSANNSGTQTSQNSQDLENSETPEGLALVNSLISKENTLTVNDQASGATVVVAQVALEYDSWIAVHEDRNGTPGNVLGALWLPAGTKTDAVVELLRPTLEGGNYYAMLHEDIGSDHKFDVKIDKPVLDAKGMPVMAKFTARTKQTQTQ